jgi:hypothetical protein
VEQLSEEVDSLKKPLTSILCDNAIFVPQLFLGKYLAGKKKFLSFLTKLCSFIMIRMLS